MLIAINLYFAYAPHTLLGPEMELKKVIKTKSKIFDIWLTVMNFSQILDLYNSGKELFTC
jgi:hypothetical protein